MRKRREDSSRGKRHHRKVALATLLMFMLLVSLFRPQALAFPYDDDSEMLPLYEAAALLDEPFSKKAFDECDALVLATASYLEIGGEPSSIGDKIAESSDAELVSNSWLCDFHGREFVQSLASSRRYSSIKVALFDSSSSETPPCQFCAMIYDIPDGPIYVAFRGTDNTVLGWEEDALASCDGKYPAQEKARKFLENAARLYPERDIWVGGHSKGGNMAEYAAATASDETFTRLVHISSFDGFGFGENLPGRTSSVEYNAKLAKLSPEQSIFGRLYESRDAINEIVVSSQGEHFCQHATTNWNLSCGQLVQEDGYAKLSDAINTSINEWIYSYSPEERKQLVNAFFSVVHESGLVQWTDFAIAPRSSLDAIISEANKLPSKERSAVLDAIGKLVSILVYHGVLALPPTS